MKGEERVRDVTEADTAGRRQEACVRRVRKSVFMGAWRPREAGPGWALPLCAAVLRSMRSEVEASRRRSSAEKGIWWMPWH